MKEAAGEANMTVITIVLIGVVAAVGLVLIPRLMSSLKERSCCTDAGGKWAGASCNAVSGIDFASAQFESCKNAS